MRFFKGPLAPQSEVGRVVVAVLVAVIATVALLEWTPVGPSDHPPPPSGRGTGRAAGNAP